MKRVRCHWVDHRTETRSLEAAHIEPLTWLPLYHEHPFDRLIAATALLESLTVVSADQACDACGVN